MKYLEGWIFDVYVSGHEIALWIIDREGQAHRFSDSYNPSFYAGGDPRELSQLRYFLLAQRWHAQAFFTYHTDLFLKRQIRVLQVKIEDPRLFPVIFERVTRLRPRLTYYNGDIPLAQMYLLEKGAFPLAFCRCAVTEENRLRRLEVNDSPWDLDYTLPPLRRMVIRFEGDAWNPNHGYRGPLEVETEDGVRSLDGEDTGEMLETLRALLLRHDPDLLVTDWGDSFILPHLMQLARQHRIPLPLNRDPSHPPLFRRAHSYFSYGRIVYRPASQTLLGRWHIDRENAFLTDDYGLEGAFEIARLTGIPVQRVVRTSTGTGISAMEIATAFRRGILIPWHKQEPETWKSALDLVGSDKGGLVFQPVLGLHEQVAEIDFVSMYPSIMAHFNISPETVHCSCPSGRHVPEIGYTVCQERRGLVSETIAPLIQKRIAYKQRIKEMSQGASQDAREHQDRREVYRRRQSAHKWLLVTCFGYLGYKNARFGKIEAHEAVTAYGRECLLGAKEIAERRGFRVLHANVDSLWVQKRGLGKGELEGMLDEITQATGIPIALEGIYRWVAFLPSRVDAQMSVANRYIGAFDDGEIKMRGIEARRHDTPPYIARAQVEMIQVLAGAHSRRDMEGQVPRVIEMACAHADALRSGLVPYQDLVITKRLSKDPGAYTRDTHLAIAAKEMVGDGIALSPGESIQYIITEEHAAVPSDRVRAYAHYGGSIPYDANKYLELLIRAVETLLIPLGIGRAQIEESIKAGALERERLPRLPQPRRISMGPLFDYAAQ